MINDKPFRLPLYVFMIPLIALIVLPIVAAKGLGVKLAFFFTEVLIGLPCLLHTPRQMRPVVCPLGLKMNTGSIRTIAYCLLLLPLIQLSTFLIEWIVPFPEELRAQILDSILAQGTVEKLISYSTILVVAPVMEEVFFRGAVTWLWSRQFGRYLLLVGPAFVFAFAHMNPWMFPGLFILGLLLGHLRLRTDSLIPGIVVHAANNGLALFLLIWMQ